MTIKEFYINVFLDFICKYSPELIEKARKISNNPKGLIRSHIAKHIEYGTIVPWYEKEELVALCNFDVTNTTAYIKNCVVHPHFRNKNILKKLTIRALATWPFLTHIEFERSLKGKPRKTIAISQFLKSATSLSGEINARSSISTKHTSSTFA